MSVVYVYKIRMNKKILMIMPKFPYPATGACEQGRVSDIKHLLELGFTLEIITKIAPEKMDEIERVKQMLGIEIFGVPYKMNQPGPKESWQTLWPRLKSPLRLDGAANEYFDPEIQTLVQERVATFQPDIMWYEYTFLWPLYPIAQEHNLPIIIRSHNFEPIHFLQEDGKTFVNLLKFIPKIIGEWYTTRVCDALFSISAKEAVWYRRIGGGNRVFTYPSRRLAYLVQTPLVQKQQQEKIHLVFMGSSYNIPHNRKAARFLIEEVMPLLEMRSPNTFVLHITGGKLPPQEHELAQRLGKAIVYEGYVPDLDSFLSGMDIAVVPSLYGGGLQLKIFEPLCRGIPLVTSERGLAGYPFFDKVHLRLASTAEEFCDSIIELKTLEQRITLGQSGKQQAINLFSHEKSDQTLFAALGLDIHH